MLKFKKFLTAGVAALAVGALSLSAFAASVYSSPAEALAGLTGKTVETVTAERKDTGKSYGTLANDAGVLDEFKTAMLELKKDQLNARVAAGKMTQAEADALLAKIEANLETCDGTGSARIGQGYGLGFGSNGRGMRSGNGFRGSNGQGMGLRNGSCGR